MRIVQLIIGEHAHQSAVKIFQILIGSLIFLAFLDSLQIILPLVFQFSSTFYMVFFTRIIDRIGNIDIFQLDLVKQNNRTVLAPLRHLYLRQVILDFHVNTAHHRRSCKDQSHPRIVEILFQNNL